jgi:hypothetical protein
MLVILPNPHPGAPTCPLYPQSVTSQKVWPNSLLFRCFHLRLAFESIKGFGSVSYISNPDNFNNKHNHKILVGIGKEKIGPCCGHLVKEMVLVK